MGRRGSGQGTVSDFRIFRLDEASTVRAAVLRSLLLGGGAMLLCLGLVTAVSARDADVPEDFQRSLSVTAPPLLVGIIAGLIFAVGKAVTGARRLAASFSLVVGEHVVRRSVADAAPIQIGRSEVHDIVFGKATIIRAKDGRWFSVPATLEGDTDFRAKLAMWNDPGAIDVEAEAREATDAVWHDPARGRPATAHEPAGKNAWDAWWRVLVRPTLIGFAALGVLYVIITVLLGKAK